MVRHLWLRLARGEPASIEALALDLIESSPHTIMVPAGQGVLEADLAHDTCRAESLGGRYVIVTIVVGEHG